jgi:hypothetical protein
LWNTTDPLLTALNQPAASNFFSNDSIPTAPNVLKTGKDDIKNIHQYVSYDNYTQLDIWRTPIAVSGTDGTNFKPHLKESDGLYVWVENLLRPVLFVFLEGVTLYGVSLNR